MEANLPSRRDFPYSNWGAAMGVLGAALAVATGFVLGGMLATPAFILDDPGPGETSAAGNVIAQFGAAIGFVMVPILIAIRRGAASARQALTRLGVRRFKPSALLWMVAAVVAYLVCAAVYMALVGEPDQEDIAESFGSLPFQILLIAIAAPIGEEVCFRGFLFGGLRERFPRWAAALISAGIFGALHAVTGLSAVPVLIAFGLILALLYEKTGSIVPGIALHMLNNSAALLAQ